MAPGGSRRPVDFPYCTDHRKGRQLKLGPEHVPFPCSLRELVLDRYSEPVGVGSHAHPMQQDELLAYLKNIDNFSLSPWVALAAQTEAIGDTATPPPEQIATLCWLGKALEIWERQFPLEGRIAAQVRRLKPLLAALAVTDPSFLQPGAHPLHQLLDSIQGRAIGWQARLDRAGSILEQQVNKAVEDSRQWFDHQATDLSDICAEFSATAERDQARSKRMVQRVVEVEAGKVKTAAAKQEAAQMINAALQKHPAPEDIGDFLKGPWYTSAQLLLLKYGVDSEQWQKMSTTTVSLLDSFQSTEEADEERRQHIFEAVTKLPKEMRRWLLSLHHDTEAVNEAMGLVEFAHLRILRRQPLELVHIAPIVVEGEHASVDEGQSPGALRNWQEGQWFSVDSANDGIVRVQLVLKVEQSQQLLFTNLAGIKVLKLNFSEFQNLIAQDKVRALYSGASFSLCLAQAVGIDSVEILEALASALAQAQPEPSAKPESRPQPGSESSTQSKKESEPALIRGSGSASTPKPPPEPEPGTEPEAILETDLEAGFDLDADLDLDLELELELDSNLGSKLELEPESPLDPGLQETHAPDNASAPQAVEEIQGQLDELLQSFDEADTTLHRDRPAQQEVPSEGQKPLADEGYLIEQAEQIKARGGYWKARGEAQRTEEDIEIEEIIAQPADNYTNEKLLSDHAEGIPEDQENALDQPEVDDASLEFLKAQVEDSEAEAEADPLPGAAADTDAIRKVNLPMGAWLGFHDGETPLMARLAVYDLEEDQYIFVNRQGVKMRQVSRMELLSLIDNGLVDILETNSNFREEVAEVRKNLDQE